MSAALPFDRKPLGELCVRTSAWNPQREPRERLTYVDVSAVSSERLSIVAPQELVAASAPSRARKIIEQGDTLFATIRPALRRIAFVPAKFAGELASTAFCVIRPNPKKLLPEFAFYAVQTEEFVDAVVRQERGASYPAVRDKDILGESIPVPPLDEQQKIAAVLGKVRAAVAVEGDLVRVARELKQAALRQLFTRGLRNEPQKQTALGPAPESWDIVPLSQIASLTSGGTPFKGDPQNWNGVIPWATPKDMKRPRLANTIDHISEQGLEAGSRLAPAGSLFVVIRGMILMRTVPVALASVPMAFNQDMKAIMPGQSISSEFLLYAFEANRSQLFALVGTSAHGTRTLMSSALEQFSMPVPPEAEQREIAALLGTLDSKIAHHEARQTLLRELFRTLLHDLLTARHRVTSFRLDGSLEFASAQT